jgi:hypothetical protein
MVVQYDGVLFRDTTPHPDSQRASSNATPARNPAYRTQLYEYAGLDQLERLGIPYTVKVIKLIIKLEDDKGYYTIVNY